MGSEAQLIFVSKMGPTITPVNIWWICWACVWTVPIAVGMVYLIAHRKKLTLRVRGLGLSLSAIALLHLYWISVQFHTVFDAIQPPVTSTGL